MYANPTWQCKAFSTRGELQSRTQCESERPEESLPVCQAAKAFWMRCSSGLNDAKCSVPFGGSPRRSMSVYVYSSPPLSQNNQKKSTFWGQVLTGQKEGASDREVIAALGTSEARRGNDAGEKWISFVIDGVKRWRVEFLVGEKAAHTGCVSQDPWPDGFQCLHTLTTLQVIHLCCRFTHSDCTNAATGGWYSTIQYTKVHNFADCRRAEGTPSQLLQRLWTNRQFNARRCICVALTKSFFSAGRILSEWILPRAMMEWNCTNSSNYLVLPQVFYLSLQSINSQIPFI